MPANDMVGGGTGGDAVMSGYQGSNFVDGESNQTHEAPHAQRVMSAGHANATPAPHGMGDLHRGVQHYAGHKASGSITERDVTLGRSPYGERDDYDLDARNNYDSLSGNRSAGDGI